MVVALAVLGSLANYGLTRAEDPTVPRSAPVSTAATRSVVVVQPPKAKPVKVTAPTSFLVADATGPSVSLFSAPDVPYAEKPALASPTHEGLPVIFPVLEDKGPWLKVRVSSRPNNLVLWVQREQVTLRTVPNHVRVEVGARRVTVFHGDDVLLRETVAIGADRTPTPLGTFFVDGTVPLSPDGGPYGAGQVSVAGFSDALQSFGGGIGQIAMHGTNRPQLLGQNVSNGCVRMSNDAITRMMFLAPLGTPVDIVA